MIKPLSLVTLLVVCLLLAATLIDARRRNRYYGGGNPYALGSPLNLLLRSQRILTEAYIYPQEVPAVLNFATLAVQDGSRVRLVPQLYKRQVRKFLRALRLMRRAGLSPDIATSTALQIIYAPYNTQGIFQNLFGQYPALVPNGGVGLGFPGGVGFPGAAGFGGAGLSGFPAIGNQPLFISPQQQLPLANAQQQLPQQQQQQQQLPQQQQLLNTAVPLAQTVVGSPAVATTTVAGTAPALALPAAAAAALPAPAPAPLTDAAAVAAPPTQATTSAIGMVTELQALSTPVPASSTPVLASPVRPVSAPSVESVTAPPVESVTAALPPAVMMPPGNDGNSMAQQMSQGS